MNTTMNRNLFNIDFQKTHNNKAMHNQFNNAWAALTDAQKQVCQITSDLNLIDNYVIQKYIDLSVEVSPSSHIPAIYNFLPLSSTRR